MPDSVGFGLLAGEGLGVISCQLLSAGIAIISVGLIAVLVRPRVGAPVSRAPGCSAA